MHQHPTCYLVTLSCSHAQEALTIYIYLCGESGGGGDKDGQDMRTSDRKRVALWPGLGGGW